MPMYVSLINWTDQGIRNFRDTLKRADAFAELVESKGGKVREILWTIGPYDIVAVVEAPDDETYTSVALAVGSLGNVRTTSLRGFDREEMARIIEQAG
jgi:uncharacterized protein with GYD domain